MRQIRKGTALLVSFVLLLMLLLTACNQTTTSDADGSAEDSYDQTEVTSDAPGAGAEKVAVLLAGVKDDYGYNYACYGLAQELEEKLGLEAVVKENVSDTSDAEGVIEELINQGCKIVISTQFGFLDATMNVAERHPDVAFYYLGNSDQNHDNFSVSNGQQWDPWYLCGMLAAMNSSSGSLGFVASMPVPDVMIAINSFELGAQSIDEAAETNVVFTGAWDDSGLATTAASQLIDSGCDVIAQFQDTPKPIVDLCQSEGVPVFGCNADAMELAPDVWISAMCADWDGLLTLIDETVKGNYECVNQQGGFDVGRSAIARTGELVTDEMLSQVEAVKEQMKNKTFNVFEGPIYDQEGVVRFEEGYVPTSAEINVIDWFVQGVNGSVN